MKQERKRSPKGARTQKMMSFRIDLDNLVWLDQFENKGMVLNELMYQERNIITGVVLRKKGEQDN